MHIESDWNFEEAVENINAAHPPWGYVGPQIRNRQLESWGQLVGRTRALTEFDLAIEEHGSITALSKKYHIAVSTLRGLRSFYSDLPADKSKAGIRAGLILGQWRLIRRLGSGGNAEVWEAKNTSQKHAAIKILKYARGGSLKRFLGEIQILKQLGSMLGILPLLDTMEIKQIDTAKHVWLALPVATPIFEVLEDRNNLDEIIDGVRTVAETLATLHTQDISHRDLKPENLFSWQDKWVVSDFGIASFPSKESLTVANKKLGPLYYIAPEMLTKADSADGTKADVYSLAKTLWVLVTGQKYPPPGEQRIAQSNLTLNTYLNHPQVRILDYLIDRATRHRPEERPSMADFANELRLWLKPLKPSFIENDVDWETISKALQQERAIYDEEVFHRSRTASIIEDIRNDLRLRMERIMTDCSNRLSYSLGGGGLDQPLLQAMPNAKYIADASVKLYTPYNQHGMLIGWTGVQLEEPDSLHILGVIAIRYEKQSEILWHNQSTALAGSAKYEHEVEDLFRKLEPEFYNGIKEYVHRLQSGSKPDNNR